MILEAKKRKKIKSGAFETITTGDIELNIRKFNKLMGTDFNNPSTEEAKARKATEKANKDILGLDNINSIEIPETSNMDEFGSSMDVIGGGSEADGGETSGECSGLGEALKLIEAKRNVRRYFIRPQNIFCSNKAEVIMALIQIENENCSVYTLKNLGDIKDTTKLTPKDIIYYYDEGILYDKNHVRVMDYDLYIKHEEERRKLPDTATKSDFKREYEDRLTVETELEEDLDSYVSKAMENPFNLDFDSPLTENPEKVHTCVICGEEFYGYGNNPSPVKDGGVCCDACNVKFVIPARLSAMRTNKESD